MKREMADAARPDKARPTRAAEYVRMSTDYQRYSTENQTDAIRHYAAAHGIEVVRTYADHGRSGLSISGRAGLQTLLDDVREGRADSSLILVYDVSRWGRFQNADESAYYEYLCKRSGIAIEYCTDGFENDGSPVATIVKGVKRAMAGEYSRQLSAKVFAGQCRLIELGYRQGGPPGFGLRRQLIDDAGTPKARLSRGEHKSIQTDRVVLIPGPPEEVETVNWIFRSFVEEGRNEREIAELLNRSGQLTDLDRPWSRGAVHAVLTNEKYAGHNVWNRTSCKLGGSRIRNEQAMWVRRDDVFPPVVDRRLFETANIIIRERSRSLTDEEMLEALHGLLSRRGFLSGLVIDETDGLPSSGAYATRFGSLLRAYQLVGFTPDRDYRYVQVNRALRAMYPGLVGRIIAGIEGAGGVVSRDPATDLLTLNDEFTASLVLARHQETSRGAHRWHVRMEAALRPDITIAARLDEGNEAIRDYYFLPRAETGLTRLRLAEENGFSLDAFRFESLDPLFELAARTTIPGVT